MRLGWFYFKEPLEPLKALSKLLFGFQKQVKVNCTVSYISLFLALRYVELHISFADRLR